jgi:lipopolysaccharide transport protein LptA
MMPGKILPLLIFYWLLSGPSASYAQVLPTTKTFTPEDTTRTVEILPGVRKLEYRKVDSLTELQILSGNVKLKQGNSWFSCDSCVINKRLNLFEAFGNVHINDADTADVYADRLRYLTDKKIAYLNNNVRLADGEGTLTTNELEYDLNTKVGFYKKGGKVVNKKTVLTSEEGFYYADLKDIYFKKNVKLKDTSYYLESDSLLYNTETETARFIAETYIKDSSGRIVRTREGYYNLKTGDAEFGRRSTVEDGPRRITGDIMKFSDSTGISMAEGNAILIDTADGITIIANLIYNDRKKDAFLATQKPLMIIKQDDDSVYVAADTLFSARLTDLYGSKDSIDKKDTLKGVKVIDTKTKDSTNRYLEAFRNVRVFNDSLQAVCDSLFYSFKDSVFRLFDDPVVWNQDNQITGDTILLFTKNKKAHKMEVYKNSFIASLVKPEIYNQVKSNRMDAYFREGDIDSVRARGLAECIYYIMDEDSAFTGINQSQSDLMDIFFREKELQRVVFRSAVQGTIWPMQQKTPQEMRLQNFKWLDNRRPKTRYELFE